MSREPFPTPDYDGDETTTPPPPCLTELDALRAENARLRQMIAHDNQTIAEYESRRKILEARIENLVRLPRTALPDIAPAEIQAILADPDAVHINMLRGTIAKPSVEQIRHIYPKLRDK